MIKLVLAVLLLLVPLCQAAVLDVAGPRPSSPRDSTATQDQDFSLPKGFLWGAGVSALQTEGAWNESGKAESAADWVIHTLGSKAFPELHDVAADSYHRYLDDVEKAAELKLTLYKFSMSWARLLPTANANKPNPEGVQFYHNLIKAIKAKAMTPLVILYHFDHPRILEDEFHGWQSPKMADKFGEYAKFAFEQYGNDVELWATINEPNMYCDYFNNMYVTAGLRKPEEVGVYDCMHNNVLGHLQASRRFKQGGYKGKLGYTALLMYGQPATTDPADVYASDAFNQMHFGTSFHPVVFGDYPEVVKSLAGEKLPKLSDQDKAELKDSADFLGINIYFGMTVSYDPNAQNTFSSPSGGGGGGGVPGMAMRGLMEDLTFVKVDLSTKAPGGSPFTMIDPNVMRNGLLWTHQTFKKPIVICENGYADVNNTQGLHDRQRAAYHSAQLRALVSTVRDYGVEVLAYSAWSLIDSFEHTAAYTRPFGLIHVDYANGTLDRSLKDSSSFWIEMAETKAVPLYEPEPSGGTDSRSSVATSSSSLVAALLAAFAMMMMRGSA